MKRKQIAAAVVLCSALFCSVSQAAKWRKVTSQEGGFSVSMPGEPTPEESTGEAGSPAKPIRVYWLMLSTQNIDYVAQSYIIPAELKGADVQSLVEKMRDAIVKNPDVRVLGQTPIVVKGLSGYLVRFKAATGESATFEFLNANGRVFVLGGIRRKETGQKDVDKFLDSFEPQG